MPWQHIDVALAGVPQSFLILGELGSTHPLDMNSSAYAKPTPPAAPVMTTPSFSCIAIALSLRGRYRRFNTGFITQQIKAPSRTENRKASPST